ncbi:hypothetical protein PHYC_03177 [Phycisphaerales bacterium]|nr:hypothetical protein PHYC_03177 [Phycisphaerales bacterium]
MPRSPAQRAARDQRIVRLYKHDRLTCAQIAARLRLNTSTVARIISRRGLMRPNGWNAKPVAAHQARNALIKRLYTRDKLTAEDIAVRVPSLTASGVRQVLHRMGVKGRKPGSWSPPRPPEFYAIRAFAHRIAPQVGRGPDTSTRHFAKMIGTSPERLRAHLRAIGTPKRLGRAATITFDDAVQIKALLVKGDLTFGQLAEQFGLSDSTIWAISVGRAWKDAPWPAGKKYQPRSTGRRTRGR